MLKRIMQKTIPAPSRVLIIQQKMVGDVLTSSVLFEALRKEFPTVRLDYLINKNTYPVVMNHPDIDNFILFDAKDPDTFRQLKRLGKEIRRNKYDVVIDVYSKLSSNYLSFFSRAPIRISYEKWYTKILYSHTYSPQTHSATSAGLAIENRLMLLKDILHKKVHLPKPRIYLTKSEISNAEDFLEKHGIDLQKPLLMISILGSSPRKTYPFLYMAQLLDWIPEYVSESQILLNYLPEQADDIEEIYNACKPETREKIYPKIYGKSLREFLGICYHCHAIIGNEGGAINMGKALEKKTFSIFCPWIKQEAWSIFEDDANNISVHLKNYFPEIYEGREIKNLKEETSTLYIKLKPQLFQEKFKYFLKQLNNLKTKA